MFKRFTPFALIATVAAGLAVPAVAQSNIDQAQLDRAALLCGANGLGRFTSTGNFAGCIGDVITDAQVQAAQARALVAEVEAAVAAGTAPSDAASHEAGVASTHTWEGGSVPMTPQTIILRSLGDGMFVADGFYDLSDIGWRIVERRDRS